MNFTDVDDKIIKRARDTAATPSPLPQGYVDAIPAAHGRVERAAAHRPAPRLPDHRRDRRHGADPDRPRATPTNRRAMSIFGCARMKIMASSAAAQSNTPSAATATALATNSKRMPRTSPCGRRRKQQTNRPGPAPGAWAGPAGISNARPWPGVTWAPPSTSTAAATTWSSRTTRTRSPKAKAATPRPWPAIGCTTACCNCAGRRCPNHWATSSRWKQFLAAHEADVFRLLVFGSHYRKPLASMTRS